MKLPQPTPIRCGKCIFRFDTECTSVLGPSCMYDHKKMSDASKKGRAGRRSRKMHCCHYCTNEDCPQPNHEWMSDTYVCEAWKND